jgi:hypothetical protein
VRKGRSWAAALDWTLHEAAKSVFDVAAPAQIIGEHRHRLGYWWRPSFLLLTGVLYEADGSQGGGLCVPIGS